MYTSLQFIYIIFKNELRRNIFKQSNAHAVMNTFNTGGSMKKKNPYTKEIKIVIKNPLSKEKSVEKIKELCDFLSKTQRMPLDKNT